MGNATINQNVGPGNIDNTQVPEKAKDIIDSACDAVKTVGDTVSNFTGGGGEESSDKKTISDDELYEKFKKWQASQQQLSGGEHTKL